MLDYTYDDDARLSTVTLGGATIAGYAYNPDALPTTTTLPAANGYVETRSWDRAGRLGEIKHSKAGSDLARFTYTRDPVGNPTRIDKTAGAVESYAYDQLDRLTEVCYQASCPGAGDPFVRWSYDEVGNRLSETRPAGTTTYSYDNADQLTQQAGLGGTISYGYDENGNQLATGSRTFTYDLNDRLVSTSAGGTTLTYAYDGDGKRLSESDGSSATRFLWDTNQPLPELALERNGAGTLLRRYHHGLSLISMRNGAGEDFYYHPDGLGSIANVTDANGATQWTYEYEPYGAERTATPAPGAPVNRIRYTGAYLDVDSGLYHLRARQYDPTNGRFLATDPVAADVSDPYVAAYLYADARPGLLTDPSGLTPEFSWRYWAGQPGFETGFYSPSQPGIYGGDEANPRVRCVDVPYHEQSWCYRPEPATVHAEPVAAGPLGAAKAGSGLLRGAWRLIRSGPRGKSAANGVGGGSQRAIGPAGDAAARGLSRIDRFRALQRDGIQVGSQRYSINEHVINSVRKSGRRHITPEDLIEALQQAPTLALPGSRVFTNPHTGSRFFVNDANEVVGVWARGFR